MANTASLKAIRRSLLKTWWRRLRGISPLVNRVRRARTSEKIKIFKGGVNHTYSSFSAGNPTHNETIADANSPGTRYTNSPGVYTCRSPGLGGPKLD